MKISDYIIKYFQRKGVDTVFCITGGACAHLIESVRTSTLITLFNYHEQACAMAADGYARISKKPAIVLVTNGPGSTNCITGVVGAWQDGIPMIILSGQVTRNHTIKNQTESVRQIGVQEVDIVSIMKHCTNFSIQIHDVNLIPNILETAWNKAITGRMGPVWIDIPIDIQASECNLEYIDSVSIPKINIETNDYVNDIYNILSTASRPIIIAGNGIHLSNSEEAFKTFIRKVNIPVIATWSATDIFRYDDNLYIGNFGIFGERAPNIAVQEADVILILGSRLSIPCIGYNVKEFGKNAKKIMIDIDESELNKTTLNIDFKYKDDLNNFFKKMENYRG
jgi:acetolactate synthase-1/2/3 large subunit